MPRYHRRAAVLLLACAVLPFTASAAYPDRPIKVVVPFPAGQGADILTRVLAERLATEIGSPVVVENRPGAGGVVGSAYAAKLPADGYNLLVGSSGPLSIAPHVNAAVSYDVMKDFTPIANLAAVTQVMVTAAGSSIASVHDLIAKAKSSGSLQFGSSGIGSTSHLMMEYFAQRSGLSLAHIPYTGGPQAMIDVIAQRVPVMFDALPGILSNIRAGKLRALAVSSKARSPFLPEVPTVEEAGVAGFGTEGWIGLLAPAGVDPAIVKKLNDQINRILSEPGTRAKLNELAFRPLPGSPEDFSRFLASEYTLWRDVSRKAGVKPE